LPEFEKRHYMNTAKLLLSENLISSSQYKEARAAQKTEGKNILHHLIAKKVITSDALVKFQADRLGMKREQRARLSAIPIETVHLISPTLAQTHRILPIAVDRDVLTLGMTDPVDDEAMDAISRHLSMVIRPVLVAEDDLSWSLSKYYGLKEGFSPRDTMPRIPQPSRAASDYVPRETISWGITIEDALTNAVRITAEQNAHSNVYRVSSVPPQPVSRPPEETDSTDDGDAASLADEKTPQSDGARQTTEVPVPTQADVPLERPTVVPLPPAIEGAVAPGGLDSWTDMTPATALQHTAQPRHRSFQSIPPNPSVMEARMSLLPPHRAHQRTEGELLHEIYNTESRDDLISLALEYMLRFAGRAIFLVVRKTEIRGYHVAGEYTRRDAVRTFWIPFSERSTLGQVAISGNTYLGPIGDKPADAVFCAALGGRPSHALLIPIILKRRTIGMLFADGVETQQIAWPRLNRLTEAITTALTGFITREKQKKND
jgi:hypothetical protein